MNSQKQKLHAVWDKNGKLPVKVDTGIPEIDIQDLLSSFLLSGPHYYYIVDFLDREIKFMSPKIKEVLGLDPLSARIDDIIERIHPEDMGHVTRAESMTYDFVYLHGWDNITKYKSGYCFRMLAADGTYRLFHHQALTLTTDDQGRLCRAINIHTDITHLSSENTYKATLTGVNGKTGFWVFDVPLEHQVEAGEIFTAREKEIVSLLAAGYSSQKVADELFISLHTAKQHRKNIIRKAGVKNSSELIAMCIREGLV